MLKIHIAIQHITVSLYKNLIGLYIIQQFTDIRKWGSNSLGFPVCDVFALCVNGGLQVEDAPAVWLEMKQ